MSLLSNTFIQAVQEDNLSVCKELLSQDKALANEREFELDEVSSSNIFFSLLFLATRPRPLTSYILRSL
jgi:hypothetical protein